MCRSGLAGSEPLVRRFKHHSKRPHASPEKPLGFSGEGWGNITSIRTVFIRGAPLRSAPSLSFCRPPGFTFCRPPGLKSCYPPDFTFCRPSGLTSCCSWGLTSCRPPGRLLRTCQAKPSDDLSFRGAAFFAARPESSPSAIAHPDLLPNWGVVGRGLYIMAERREVREALILAPRIAVWCGFEHDIVPWAGFRALTCWRTTTRNDTL